METKCKYYIPANYAVCATCQVGGYCNGVCEKFTPKGEMTVNGVSTAQAGQEKYEYFRPAHRPKETFVQYDYRTPGGELFSCVKPTLQECRECRDKWLQNMNLKNQSNEY